MPEIGTRGGLRRVTAYCVRTVVAVTSLAVLAATGYAWGTYSRLSDGLARADVIKPAQRQGPSGPAPADGATDVLLVGLDSRTDAHGNPLPRQTLAELSAGVSDGVLNTDTLILLRIPNDPARPTTGFSIPRDTYLRLPDNLGKHKVNSAYARGARAESARLAGEGGHGDDEIRTLSRKAGQRMLIQTVEDLTGATIDHYAEVNLLGFAELTRVLGGVPVCLREPVRDRYSGADLPAGRSTVSGSAALSFVRQRHGLPGGDIDRVARQQAFLAGLANKILDAGLLTNPTTVNSLLDTVRRYVVVDQHWDLMDFARRMAGASAEGITFRTIPLGAGLSTGDGAAIQVDRDEVRAAVDEPVAPTGTTSSEPALGDTTHPVAPFTENTFPGRTTPSVSSTPTTSTSPAPEITADSIPCVN